MTWSWMLLGVQALCAVGTVRLMARQVMPCLSRFSQPGLVLDVWGPLTLVLPMFAFVHGMEHSVSRAGWPVIGGPMWLGILGIGMALIRSGRIGRRSDAEWPMSDRIRLAGFVTGTAALVLLLGAAHDLTVWIGQVAFAIAAVLLWLNTPEQGPSVHSIDIEHDVCVGGGLALAMFCSLAQAAAIWMVGSEQRIASIALAAMAGSFVLAVTASCAGPVPCLRVGGWTVVYGVLFGLGTMSLAHLILPAFRAMNDGEYAPAVRVAYGFGSMAATATLVLGCAALVAMAHRLSSRWKMIAGAAVIVVATIDVVRHMSDAAPEHSRTRITR